MRQSEIKTMCETRLTKGGKRDYLEGQSRRNKVVLDRSLEPLDENWKETEDKVKTLMSEKTWMWKKLKLKELTEPGNRQ